MPQITYGRWNPSEIRDRIVDDTWTAVESVSGLEKIIPSSITFTGSGNLDQFTGTINCTNVTTITVNGLFSNTYSKYYMSFEFSTNSTTPVYVRCRLNNGSSDLTSSYYWNSRVINSTTVGKTYSNNTSFWALAEVCNQPIKEEAFFYRPSIGYYHSFFKKGFIDDGLRDDINYGIGDYAGISTNVGSYTGLTFYQENSPTGLLTGTMSFYGYK